MKWWKRGASHILEVCLYNAYIIDQHGKVGSEKRDCLSFRIALALIGTFTTRVRYNTRLGFTMHQSTPVLVGPLCPYTHTAVTSSHGVPSWKSSIGVTCAWVDGPICSWMSKHFFVNL